jgi:calcineurin-like phosphoesterase family protein
LSNIWITADTHYNHKNIVKGESDWNDKSRCRKFKSLKTYNDIIVKNINSVVEKKDWLYHLGDWSLGERDSLFEFRERLKCENIVIVCGNHDLHILKNVREINSFFNGIYVRLEREWNHQEFILDHYPIYSWHNQKKGSIHLYGHVHEELNYHKNALCVSLDCHPEFRPFSLEEIRKIINNRHNGYP